MKSIGIDIAKLGNRRDDGMNARYVHPACPGARVFVTREDMTAMVRGGESFLASETKVPPHGYGHARVQCGRPVEAWKGPAHVVYAGLCQSCSGVERDNRADLHRRQNPDKPARSVAA